MRMCIHQPISMLSDDAPEPSQHNSLIRDIRLMLMHGCFQSCTSMGSSSRLGPGPSCEARLRSKSGFFLEILGNP